MITKKIIILIIAVHFLCFPTIRAIEQTDSIDIQNTCTSTRFNVKQLILPGALIAVGASSLFFSPMKDLDKSIQKDLVDLRGNHHRIKLDEYLRYVPTAINISLTIAGKKAKYNTTDRLLIKATSIVSMYILTQGLKHSINRTRPDGSDSHSFPSGHTAGAFLGAESLRQNYGNWWGLAGYTAATATAFLRLYNNRHWLGDVISGAGIGILSAHIGYWLLPFEKRILGLDKKRDTNNKSILALPTYNPSNKTYGLALAIQF